jgi:phenylacetate-coenzyme A ligase PaaK-like adenylate-forming protein
MVGFAWRALALARGPKLDPEKLGQLQQQRLDRLVRHAVARSPFYRAKFRGLDLGHVDLERLPTTSKTELMAHFDDTVTDPAIQRADLEAFLDDPSNEGKWYLGKYAPSHTSGSQGQPMLMVQPRRVLDLLFQLQMTRGNIQRATPREAMRRLMRPARLAVVTLKRGFYPSASAFEYMPKSVSRFMRVLWLSQTDPDVVARLNAYRPTALTAYAGVLELLALEALAGRLNLAPELLQVTNNSEVLTDRARERITAAFGVPVLNNYATGECPFLSYGCPTDEGAHVNADWAILEVVDERGRRVPAGTPGSRVLITNLANDVQPFIRYEVGDVVTMAEGPCRCGSRMPRVARIEGRSADTFWIRDGDRFRTMIGSVFKNAFDYTREVREWQVVQTERNGMTVRLEPLPGEQVDLPRARASLMRQLQMYAFDQLIDVRFEVVPRLGPDPRTGKFRRMHSLVGPPAQVSRSLRRDGAHAQDDTGPHVIPMRVPAHEHEGRRDPAA